MIGRDTYRRIYSTAYQRGFADAMKRCDHLRSVGSNPVLSVDSLGQKIDWPDPTEEMLNSSLFEAIWECIKSWDINVPEAYSGYCGATGNHVRAIIDAIRSEADGEHTEERRISR